MKKGELCFGLILVFIILFISLVNAEMLISSANVRYDSKIIDEFNNLENNPLNETFVPIYFTLRDFSEARDLLATLNESKIKNIAIRDSSKKIGLDLTKEEFDKLINDPRIETIYYDAPMYLSQDFNWGNFSFLVAFIVIILSIFFIIKKRKK